MWGHVLYPTIHAREQCYNFNSGHSQSAIHRVVLKHAELINVCRESHLTRKRQNCTAAGGHRTLGRAVFIVKDATSGSAGSRGAWYLSSLPLLAIITAFL